ncbi:MAG: P-loop NTPase [Myxococcota bacterium]|jgi:flagellar biosynthesis protein FlhG
MSRVAERIISVGGGKGGVGKSLVAANLAIAMAQAGRRVVLVDGDLGAANLHTLFGIERPGPTIQTFIEHGIESLEGARVETGVPNLTLVRGASAVVGAANISHTQKQRLLRHVERLDADVVLVDVGAGIAFNQVDFFDLADLRLLVLTPQLTSIQNGYGFAKAALYRRLDRVLKAHGIEGALDETDAHLAMLSLRAVLRDVMGRSPEVEAAVRLELATFNLRLFGNQVHDPRESAVFRAVGKMMTDFLSLPAPLLGYARASRLLHDSATRRRPYLLVAQHEEAARALRATAHALLEEPLRPRTPAHLGPVTSAAETAAA